MEGMESRRLGTKRKDLWAPCKDCKERHEACHASCEPYKEWQKMMEQLRKDEKGKEWELYDIDMVKRRWRY